MNVGLIFAGGVGSRMRSKDLPKQFLCVYNKPIIVHTIEHFVKCPQIDAIVVVCVKEWIEYFKNLVDKHHLTKIEKIVPGGDSGQLSIYNGLLAIKEIAKGKNPIVLIHDGVRPLISSDLLTRNIECVEKYGSSITSGIVKETIVEIDDEGEMKIVPDREHSRVAKAPQCFWFNDIMKAHETSMQKGITNFIDSCTMMFHYGHKLHMIDGPYENIKITTPDDFYTMRAILQVKEDAQIYGLD